MLNWADIKAHEEHLQHLLREAELDRLVQQATNRQHDRARGTRRSRSGIRYLSIAQVLGLISS